MFKMFFVSLFGFIVVLTLLFGISFLSYKSYEYFSPKHKDDVQPIYMDPRLVVNTSPIENN